MLIPLSAEPAQWGDGFMFASGLERSLDQWKRVDHFLNESRRDLASFGRELIYSSKTSDPQRTADTLLRWRDAGGSHAAAATLGKGFTDVGGHIDFFADVRARLR